MRFRDRNVFIKTAERFKVWILVRQTNALSLQYVGKAIYQPKPISCKPKTADIALIRADKKVDGLVADPFRWPEAFSSERLADASDTWRAFRTLHNLGGFSRDSAGGYAFTGARTSSMGYAIDAETGSRHEGCLTFEGKYLYGDYDLFDIVSPTAAQRTPATPTNVGPRGAAQFQVGDHRAPIWSELSQFLNQQLGVPLIQHGANFDVKPGKFEAVDAFGPEGETRTWSASEVEQKYRAWGRT